MRARDILAVIVMVIVAVVGQLLRSEDAPNPRQDGPRRPAPERYQAAPNGTLWEAETRAWLSETPAQQPRQPGWLGTNQNSVVDIPKTRRSGTGTAFAIGPGVWLTARHVVDSCDDVGLQVAPKRAIKVTDIRHHVSADLSLLRSSRAPTPISLTTEQSDDIYMVGFPVGKPGAVHGSKLGSTILRERGRYQTRERADVWAERSRIPNRDGSLGGLSGGPAFAPNGQVYGVVLAEDRRRGRVITARPATLRTLIDASSAEIGDDPSPATFSADLYPGKARELILSGRVSRVLCRVR
jgi:serine protease Do